MHTGNVHGTPPQTYWFSDADVKWYADIQTWTLLLQRIIRCGSTFHGYLCCLDLKRLFCFRRRHQLSFYNDCCSDINLADFLIILQTISIYNLNRLKKGTVIHYNESKIFGITVTSYPSADRYLLIFISDRILKISLTFTNSILSLR